MTNNALTFAVTIAQEAGEILMDHVSRDLTRTIKSSENDYATEADYASEKHILARIKAQFPQDAIVAEESGLHAQENPEYTWIIDPLDGTRNFATGNQDFGVLMCRVKGGVPDVAVAFNPIKQLLAAAVTGGGTFVNEEQVDLLTRADDATQHLSASRELHTKLVPLGTSITTSSSIGNLFASLMGTRRAYVSQSGYAWDLAAPALLLDEAGWTVSDAQGQPYRWDGTLAFGWPGLIAAPAELHGQIFELLHK